MRRNLAIYDLLRELGLSDELQNLRYLTRAQIRIGGYEVFVHRERVDGVFEIELPIYSNRVVDAGRQAAEFINASRGFAKYK